MGMRGDLIDFRKGGGDGNKCGRMEIGPRHTRNFGNYL